MQDLETESREVPGLSQYELMIMLFLLWRESIRMPNSPNTQHHTHRKYVSLPLPSQQGIKDIKYARQEGPDSVTTVLRSDVYYNHPDMEAGIAAHTFQKLEITAWGGFPCMDSMGRLVPLYSASGYQGSDTYKQDYTQADEIRSLARVFLSDLRQARNKK